MYPSLEWDPQKERNNLRKHGVSFIEAVTALEDELAVTIEDDHPSERRFISIGLGETGRVLVVVYTYRGERVRIISARKATSLEQEVYKEQKYG
jgi:uncharacterized protein